jgi:hypothetical protein
MGSSDYAVSEIFQLERFVGPSGWQDFIDLIIAAVVELMKCLPTPQRAVRWLNWKPIFDRKGRRLQAHYTRIREIVASKWRGSLADVVEVQDQVIQAIKDGKITLHMMTKLYNEFPAL